jgi:hypothetical protein
LHPQPENLDHAPHRRRWFLPASAALLVAIAVSFAACSSRLAPQAVDTSSTSSDASTVATAAPATTPRSTTPGVQPTAPSNGGSTSGNTNPATENPEIASVIEKANQEQQDALAQNDPTIMRDTATDSYYALLVQTQRSLLQSGATAIQLESLDWGAISVQGSTAQATTTETWQVTFSDGTTQENTDRNDYTLVQQNGRWLISDDAQPGSGVSSSQPGASNPNQSSNWSGYAATGGPFTSVTATWTVPTVDPNGRAGAADAAWVGIGGATSTDLIQAGTDATVTGNGQVTYSAWIEMLPKASQKVNLSVKPGDVVKVSIDEQSEGNWLIVIADQTTGQQYQSTVQYSSSLSSVEWIEEAPSTGTTRSHVVTLDNFGEVRFSGAAAELNGQQVNVAQTNAQPITMYGTNGKIAVPSVLGGDGSSFTVTRVTGAA